jgi:hypothetical protein
MRAVTAHGLRLLGHHDLAGNGDAMQVLRHEHALYVGHHGPSGQGTSILDVTDPAAPRLVSQWPAPAGTHTHKVQVGDGLLLVNHEHFPVAGPGTGSAGLAVYRLEDPLAPTPLGFWSSGGRGVHRIVYTGGRFAYLSATPDGFDDRIWLVLDLADPAHPVEVGRWWWPGQWVGGGERPAWAPGRRHAAHHALLDGDVAFLGYDDANLVVLDVTDRSRPRLLSTLTWEGGSTHTCLPLPGRKLVVATDEQVTPGPDAAVRTVRLIDVSDPRQPVVVGVVPAPDMTLARPGARFGAHNLHENQPGSYASERLVFATYFSAGLRVYDLEDPRHPREVAHFVPEAAPGQAAAQSNDVFVDAGGLVYLTDRVGGGVVILEPEPELAQLMTAART